MTAIETTVKRVLATYGTPALKEIIQNCMAQDLSWKVRIIMNFSQECTKGSFVVHKIILKMCLV